MKKSYEKPETHTVLLQHHARLLSESNKVNEYKRGNTITAGDQDEPAGNSGLWNNNGIWGK